jgi:hypothetical protein
LAEERSYNPFLRTNDWSLLRALDLVEDDDESPGTSVAFALRVTALKTIRKRKDDLGDSKP